VRPSTGESEKAVPNGRRRDVQGEPAPRVAPIESEYLILPETFKTEVCAGYSYSAVLKELDKRGFLVRKHPNMTIKPRLPELDSTRVYCIRASILEGEEC
jgi:putative DNA primase/helicase